MQPKPKGESSLSREMFSINESSSSNQPNAGFSALRPPRMPVRQPNTQDVCGYEPVDWTQFFDREQTVDIAGNKFHAYHCDTPGNGPVFVLLHGASHSALSWALTAKALKSHSCRVVAMDFRGHGKSFTDSDTNLAADILAADVVATLAALYGELPSEIILVGHSLGGGIAAKIASQGLLGNALKGLVVVDVVEGTAVQALLSSRNIIESRPSSFSTLAHAIKWSVRSGVIKNVDSARCSVPGHLVQRADTKYEWRTDILASEAHWRGWFSGLSGNFLAASCPKVLILAGRDRLDTELMLGQMQGKFQLSIFPHSGHMVQEDQPTKTAETLVNFARRFGLIN